VKEIGDQKGMFNPKTVVLIGASEKEESVGRAVLENQKDQRNSAEIPLEDN
jgi:acyl-CoA synthetase (NDP forming)